MARMPGRVEKQQLAAVEVERESVRCLDHACRVHRDDRAIIARDHFGTVNRRDAGDEFRRVNQVARTLGMRHEFRVREAAHHRAGAAGMVEVRMRRDDIGDLFRHEPLARQHVKRVRNRV